MLAAPAVYSWKRTTHRDAGGIMQFQSYAYGTNHWRLDPDLKPILARWWRDLPRHEAALDEFGALAGGEAYRVADHVDHECPPTLVMHDLDGNRVDRARLSPAHEALLRRLAAINRPPYEGGSWHHHFSLGYLLADPGLYCVLIITNQTAYAIHKYAPEHAAWKERLLTGDAFGATWLTEIHAGSDLGAIRTVARREGTGWRLDGEKYFASGAGLADVAIATARPEGAPDGAKGLALFLVPRLRHDGALNFTVRRLKWKGGTRAVPTGEVDLVDSEAHLIGRVELGIYYALENLTLARLANSAGAMGLARKAHLEALHRVRARGAFGHALEDHPLVRRDLTDLAVRTAAGLALTFRAVEAFDRCWHVPPPFSADYHYARLFAHLAKGRTAEHAAVCTQLGLELFGGLGFLEEVAVARLHREALVTPIWEGAANIQALDMLEVLAKKRAAEPFAAEMLGDLAQVRTSEARLARERIEGTLGELRSTDIEGAQWHGKETLRTLADAASVALLYRTAEAGGERFAKLAALAAQHLLARAEYPQWALRDREVWDVLPAGERFGTRS